ncbi:MAG: energy-coupling factor ABC transporter ATP-binding protein [Lachnospiraceae bacterium]|nr:energy-coupling factor ABC transporter ATP-binding protein [Lachnospiraceae bacterium]
MNNKSIIELKNLCFAYEQHVALRYITIDIKRGETIALQGDNGCGKSTLLKILNGILFANEGEYLFEGRPITEKSLKDNSFAKYFHQKIGFVFQNADIQLFCGSVEEEIAFGPMQMGLSREEVAKRVDDVIALIGIEHLRNRPPYHLSGGEKRKVAIACILSMNPDVLVLDEPLAGLDKKSRQWLLDFLLQLKKAGKTMIFATHDDNLATLLSDRIIDINERHEIGSIK